MSRWFVATVPLENGEPKFMDSLPEGVSFDRSGDIVNLSTDGGQYHFTAKYLGRLGEGQFGTTGRPAVIVCTANDAAFSWLRGRVPDPDNGNYRYKSLEDAWQVTAVRDWLKANGMPWVAGEFSPDPGSIYGRPTLPVVWCGQNHDIWAP